MSVKQSDILSDPIYDDASSKSTGIWRALLMISETRIPQYSLFTAYSIYEAYLIRMLLMILEL